MKIALASIGSRGDIQPYIALGTALQASGHDIRLVTHPWAKSLAESYGLAFSPVGDDIDIHHVARTFVENSSSTLQGLKFSMNFIFDSLRNCHTDLKKALTEVDIVIGHGVVGEAEAQMLGKPFVPVSIAPMGLEKVYWQSSNFVKELAVVASDSLGKKLFGGPYVSFRKDMGLPAKKSDNTHPYLALVPISPLLQKADPNWKLTTEITGFFLADTPETYQPSQKLRDFLSSGEKPVLVTFGSMFHPREETDTLFQTIVTALRETQSRGLILMPDVNSNNVDVPDTIMVIDNIPYSWLLSRVSLVVHHFGFGTTAEVLKAGLPSIPLPHIFDQNIRAKQLHKLGYAHKPLNKNKLSGRQLADAITATKNDTQMHARCGKAGEQISRENGLEKAVGLIRQTFCE